MKSVILLFSEVLRVTITPREILQGDTVRGMLQLANLGQKVLKDVVINLRPTSWALEAKIWPTQRLGSLAPRSQEHLNLSLRTGSSAGTPESLEVEVCYFEGDRRFSPPPQIVEFEVLPPCRKAEVLERYALALDETACSAEDIATVWQAAARAYKAEGKREHEAICQQKAARCLSLPIITLDIEIDEGLVLGAWSRLRFIVRNEGFGPAHKLDIRVSGDRFEGTVMATQRITKLRAGDEHVDWVDICPRAHGDSVPLRVQVDYEGRTSMARACDHTIYIPVARDEGTRNEDQTINVFVSGSGAVAVGDGAVAAGAGGAAVGGDAGTVDIGHGNLLDNHS